MDEEEFALSFLTVQFGGIDHLCETSGKSREEILKIVKNAYRGIVDTEKLFAGLQTKGSQEPKI